MNQAAELLRSRGMRATPLRKCLLGLFLANKGPYSAAEAHRELGACSLSTVYRALESLAREGLLVASRGSGGVAVYCFQPFRPLNHNHFECRKCGRLLHFECSPIGGLVDEICRVTGFDVQDAELRLTGECSACRNGRVT